MVSMSKTSQTVREKLYVIIFQADTKAGRAFDVFLLWAILFSVLAVMLESVSDLQAYYGPIFFYTEWFFTLLFTAEYFARIYSARDRLGYVKSFFGVVDLLSIFPTFLALIFHGTQALMVIRAIRLLRIFRLFKLTRHVFAAQILMEALAASRAKITVFLGSVVAMVIVVGSIIYLVEGPENGFTSIPTSIYWAVVTMTTVGYGDISPKTPLGQFIASIIMIIGYGIIAVPTGIVSVEMQQVSNRQRDRICSGCKVHGHEYGAKYCRDCGGILQADQSRGLDRPE